MAIKDCLRKLERAGYRISDKMRGLLDEGLKNGLSDEDATRYAILNAQQNVVDIADRARREGATLAPVANPISDLVQFQSRAFQTLAKEKEALRDEAADLTDKITDVNALEGHLRTRRVMGLSPTGRDKAGAAIYVDLNDDRQVIDALLQMSFATDSGRRQAFGLKGESANEMLASFREMQANKIEMQKRLDENKKKMDKLDARVNVIFSGKQQTLYQSGVPKMVVQHNMTAENLLKTDSLGGLAVPSLAVMNEGMNIEGFGEIALIGTQELAEPSQVPIFDADGYTVRFQEPEYGKAKAADRDSLWNEVYPYTLVWEPMGSLGYYMDRHLRDHPNPQGLIWQMQSSDAVKAMFLESVMGQSLEPTIKDAEPSYKWGWDNEIVDFFLDKGNMDVLNYQWEDPRRRALLLKAGSLVENVVRKSIATRLDLPLNHDRVNLGVAHTAILNTDGTISEIAFNRLREDAKRKGSKELDQTTTAKMLDARLRDPEISLAFNAWVENKVTSIMGEPFLKIGNKKVPYTLDNIVRKMKGKLRGTEQMMKNFMTEGMMRALASHRFKRLEEMRAHAQQKLGTDKDLIDNARVDIQARVNEFAGNMAAFYKYAGANGYVDSMEVLDAVRHAFVRWANNGKDLATANDLEDALNAQGFDMTSDNSVPDWLVDEGMIVAMDFLAVPVPYFEAKPQRAVMLEEFAGAVIPSDLDAESRAVFLKRGIPMKEYQVADNIDASAAKAAATAEFTQQLNNQGERTLFQSDIGFTSGLLTAARTMPFTKTMKDGVEVGTDAKQILATLKKQPNVKQSEIDAVFLEDWIDALRQSGQTLITQDELIKFLDQGGVQLKETFYAGEDFLTTPINFTQERASDQEHIDSIEDFEYDTAYTDFSTEIFEMRDSSDPFADNFTVYVDKDAGNVSVKVDETGEWLEVPGSINNQEMFHAKQAMEKYIYDKKRVPGSAGRARWTQWTLPPPNRGQFNDSGPRINHREIVLNVPTVGGYNYLLEDLTEVDHPDKGLVLPTLRREEVLREIDLFWYIEARGKPSEGQGAPTRIQTFQIKKSDFPTIDLAMRYIMEEKPESPPVGANFDSHAFPQANIIAWMRVNDRMGVRGEKILFVEEIQSDLHQAGLTGGYNYSVAQLSRSLDEVGDLKLKVKAMLTKVQEDHAAMWKPTDIMREFVDSGGEVRGDLMGDLSKKQRTLMNKYLEAYKKNEKIQAGGRTPDMPWKGDAWAELAMKRIIRMAVEEGYDQVAWTTAEQQLERYDIDEHFSRIEWDPRSDTLYTYDNDGDLAQELHKREDELEALFGAERVLEMNRQIDEKRSRWTISPVYLNSKQRSDMSGEELAFADATLGLAQNSGTFNLEMSPGDIVLDDDDQFIGSYEREWIKQNGVAFALVDESGEMVRQSLGDYQMWEFFDGAEVARDEFAFEELPELTNIDVVDEEGRGLRRRYDELMVNVTNRALRKLDKNAKVKRLGIQMEGGGTVQGQRIERGAMPTKENPGGGGNIVPGEVDPGAYWVSGWTNDNEADIYDRKPISPRFDTVEEAQQWMDNITLGFGNTQHGFDITPEIQVAAMEGQTLFQGNRANQASGTRGSITFDKQNKAIIRLTNSKDLSTFLHESAHLYLEMMGDMVEGPNASPRLVDMYTETLKYLGVNQRSEIGTEQHELFARSFEAYLREGVAPIAEIQPMFTSFKGWLTRIYTHIRRLMNNDEELTDDMRGVFDRLIASDEAISQSEDMMAYVQLYQTAEEMGVSQEVFNVYKRSIQEAHDAAVDRESKKMLKAMNRSQEAWWKDELEFITKQVREEAEKEQIFIAMQLLMHGKRTNGKKHPRPFKLSKESVLEIVGSQEFMKRLPRPYVYTREGGVDADVAAGMFGYPDGKALIEALLNAPKMEDYIKAESLRRMNEANPDPYNSAEMIESATEAVHDTKRGTILAAELRALRKQQRQDEKIVKATKAEGKREDRQALEANRGQMPKRENMAQIKAAAEMLIAGKQIRNINPNAFLQAERKAGRAAFNAMAKKDYAEAYKQKLAQIMHYEAYRAALKAKAQAARDRKYLQTFEKKAKRQRMGKGGQLEKIDAILEKIQLQMVSSTKIDKINLEKELMDAMDDGTLVIPLDVLASMTHPEGKNWRELTFQELSGIRDVIKQLEHQAKRELEIIVNGEKVVIQKAVDEVVNSIVENNEIVPIPRDEATAGESAKLSIAEGVGHWLRSSTIGRVLDKSGFGAVTRNIILPIRRAYVEKLIPRQHANSEYIAKLYKKHYSNDELTKFHKRTGDDLAGEPMSKASVLALGLNWGSEGNRQAVLEGVRVDAFGNEELVWSQESVAAALSTLDARDWAFIQDVWDYENSFYDEMAETEKRRRGIAPQKIEALPFEVQTSDGETVNLKGGYHPLAYDSRHTRKKSVSEKEFQDFYSKISGGQYLSISTRAGATYERSKNHGMVVRLSLSVIETNTRELIRDLTIGDEVNLVNRIINDKAVRAAAGGTNNSHLLKELKLWLADAAVGELPAQSTWEKSLSYLRVGFTKSKLAFNVYVTLLQLTGLTQSMAVIGSRAYGRGFLKFAGNPVGNYKMVMEKSKFMQARYGVLQTWDKDVADTNHFLKSIFGPTPTKLKSGMDVMGYYYFWPIAKFQSVVDVTTWMGAYEKGLNDPNVKSEEDAALYADAMVENAQTSGLFSDRSGLERGTLGTRTRQGQFVRLWTTLISYMLAKGNIAYEKGTATNFRKPSEVAALAIDMALLFFVEGVLSSLLYGRGPGEDDEDESVVGWAAGVTVDSMLSTVPLVREYSAAKYGSGNTPVGALVNDSYKFFEQAAQGEADEAAIKAGVKVTGTFLHLPASQTNRAVEALFKEGDTAWYEYVFGANEE